MGCSVSVEVEVEESASGFDVLLGEMPQEGALAAPRLPEDRDMHRAPSVANRDMPPRRFAIRYPRPEIEAALFQPCSAFPSAKAVPQRGHELFEERNHRDSSVRGLNSKTVTIGETTGTNEWGRRGVVPQLFGPLFRPALRARRREVHDEDFAVPSPGMLLCGVRELDALHPEAMEDFSHFRHVIQGEQELPSDGPKNLGEALKVLRFEVVVVQLLPEIWRIEKEECRRAVKVVDDLFVRKLLNLNAGKSFMGVVNDLRELFWVESRGMDHVPVIRRAAHETREGVLEDIEVSGCPLDIREVFWIGLAKKVELAAAYDRESETANEFLVMVLADPEEVHDLMVEVVQNLDLRTRLVKEHLRPACEGLNVGLVLRQELDDALRERAFSSDV